MLFYKSFVLSVLVFTLSSIASAYPVRDSLSARSGFVDRNSGGLNGLFESYDSQSLPTSLKSESLEARTAVKATGKLVKTSLKKPLVHLSNGAMNYLKTKLAQNPIPKTKVRTLLRWHRQQVRDAIKRNPTDLKGVGKVTIKGLAHKGGRPGNPNPDPKLHITAQFKDLELVKQNGKNQLKWTARKFGNPHGKTQHIYPTTPEPVKLPSTP